MAEDAVAEIERLRAENEEAQESLTAAYMLGSHEKAHEQAAHISELEVEIAELKADLEQSEICIQARLDVIDQQAARIKSLKKEIRRLKHESKVEQEFTNSYIKRLHDAEARIKELEADLEQSEICIRARMDVIDQQAAQIKSLEDALVEELARGDYFDESQECEGYWWDRKNTSDCTQNDYRRNARLKLQAKGKIGPDAKPRVWQITEERKAAIWHAVAVLKENDPDDEHLWDEEIAVLRAMLREAE